MEKIHLPLGRYRIGLQAIDEISFRDYSGSAWRGLFGHALKRTVCVTREPHCSECMTLPLLRLQLDIRNPATQR